PDVQDEGRLARSVQLAPQAARVRVESSRAAKRAELPDVLEEVFLAEDALRLLGEGDEQLVLLGRELHRPLVDPHRARGKVDPEAPYLELLAPRAGGASEDGVDPGEQLLVHERLTVRGFVCRPRRALRADRGGGEPAHARGHRG